MSYFLTIFSYSRMSVNMCVNAAIISLPLLCTKKPLHAKFFFSEDFPRVENFVTQTLTHKAPTRKTPSAELSDIPLVSLVLRSLFYSLDADSYYL